MVTPNQKRVAVLALVDEFGVSQCRAFLVIGQYRSTQRPKRRKTKIARQPIVARGTYPNHV